MCADLESLKDGLEEHNSLPLGAAADRSLTQLRRGSGSYGWGEALTAQCMLKA